MPIWRAPGLPLSPALVQNLFIHTPSLTHAHSLSLTRTHTHSLSHTHTLSLTHTHTLTHSHTHTLTLTLSLSHTLSHTHTPMCVVLPPQERYPPRHQAGEPPHWAREHAQDCRFWLGCTRAIIKVRPKHQSCTVPHSACKNLHLHMSSLDLFFCPVPFPLLLISFRFGCASPAV